MSRKIAPQISKEELENLFLVKMKSPNQLAEMFNVSRPTILKWLENYDIKKRNHNDAIIIISNNQINKQRKGYEEKHKILDNYDFLYQERKILKKSIRRISEELNVSYTLVKNYLIKYKFEHGERIDSVPEILNDKNYLIDLYNNQNKTLEEIGKIIGASKPTISIYFNNLGIETKNPNDYDKPHNFVSKAHIEIVTYIKSIYFGEIKINDRTTIGSELDIYIPEKKFAIEFNGLFWHSEECGKDENYHLNKTLLSEKNGIFLFHIFEDTWKFKKDIVKSMIANRLGLTRQKIYARNTSLKEINSYDRRDFFKENHIQGEDNATFGFGLFHNEELVACMSFSKSRFNKNFDFELIRYANKKNTIIVGGFSKLLKNFRKMNQGSIISYSDRSYASGNVYKNNGFLINHINKPSYFYVDKTYSVRYARGKFTKARIKNKFKNIDSTKTENVLMKELGYKKIWDCGTISWVLEK